MTVPVARPDASQNLLRTYFALGLSVPGTRLVREAGFEAVVGPFPHPICNFAARLALREDALERLKEFATDRAGFNVYTVPGDEPEHLVPLLVAHGFEPSHRLTQMVAPGTEAEEEELRVLRAGNEGARSAVARFMIEQFFAGQSASFRKKIADTTAQAHPLELFCVQEGEQIVAGVMLCESDRTLGIYNLCVRHGKRGKGLGGRLVRWCLARARSRSMQVTLQCEPRLEGWYQQFGFERSGAIDVFSLSKTRHPDIMTVI